MPQAEPATRRNARNLVAAICGVAVVGMVGMAYAAVPFYRAFCQATGFDGTPKRAEHGPSGPATDHTLSVRFDTNVRDLPWTVQPEVNRQTIKVGRTQLVNFTITNNGDKPMTGRATYNVSPASAAQYFTKLQCFCFSDQTIAAHTAKTFPVVYYVDSRFMQDPDDIPLSELTLSYTMFPAPDAPKPAAAAASKTR